MKLYKSNHKVKMKSLPEGFAVEVAVNNECGLPFQFYNKLLAIGEGMLFSWYVIARLAEYSTGSSYQLISANYLFNHFYLSIV